MTALSEGGGYSEMEKNRTMFFLYSFFIRHHVFAIITTIMISPSSNEPFMVSGLHGDQILGDRRNQQDSFAILGGEDELVLLLTDGMGGYSGGELASRAAVDSFSLGFQQAYASSAGERMKAGVELANAGVRDARQRMGTEGEMGTTLVAAWITAHGLRWVSVGDSLLLLIRDEKIFLLNTLHHYAAELERMAAAGEISREEALNHPSRHSLTSALMGGAMEIMDVHAEVFPLVPGDRILVASDGVGPYLDSLGPAGTRYLSLLSADELVNAILRGVERAGFLNQDNATILCAEITKE